MGQWISLATQDGRALRAYRSAPPASGPGLLLCHDAGGVTDDLLSFADLMAEEGYVVVVPDLGDRLRWSAARPFMAAASAALRRHASFRGRVGIVGFGAGGALAIAAAADCAADCMVVYYGEGLESHVESLRRPGIATVIHHAQRHAALSPAALQPIAEAIAARQDAQLYVYPDVEPGFVAAASPAYCKPAADMAYTRTLAVLRKVLGPHFDLSALWERHRACEFEIRDADATMRTMVAEPYVNHVPTMTGGFGQKELHRFYRDHFIPKLPRDTRNIPVSRTVGVDRVVNEGVLCFTHDVEIDWMLPGIPPTGRYVEVPIVGIITFRGDKLVHEHIYWDQASVLVQIGLLDPAGLPVVGSDAAKKVLDPGRPANTLLPGWRQP
ncbi:MAG TPA: dienelactone hydrolase family protein [Burkholderiales bacterium]